MLTRAKLTNFQRHRSLEVSFAGGLTALRGANEAGKSTLLRGISYAMFGVKALAAPLDDTVTWGEDVKSLRAEVDLLIDGVAYSVKRGKSGAEVNYDGGVVTGQNEVTAFICSLLKVDAGAAARLMLSGQGEIRGALEAGPKATTELIERLSEFDQIDQLLDRANERLTLGATTTTEAAIATLGTQLDAARAAAVPPSQDALDEDVARASGLVQVAQNDVERAEKEAEAAQQALDEARAADQALQLAKAALDANNREFTRAGAEYQAARDVEPPSDDLKGAVDACDELVRAADADLVLADSAEAEAKSMLELERAKASRLRDAGQECARLAHQLQQLEGEFDNALCAAPAAVDVEAKEARIAQLRDVQALSRRHESVKQFLGAADVGAVWDDTFDSLLVALKDSQQAAESLLRSAATMEQESAKARQQAAVLRTRISIGSCSFCGQDFSNVEAVKVKNAELEAQALAADAAEALHQSQAVAARTEAENQRVDAGVLREILEASRPALQALEQFPDLLAREGSDLPPTVVWIGGEVVDADTAGREAQGIAQELAIYRSRLAAQEAGEARRAELGPRIDEARKALTASQEVHRGLPAADVEGAQQTLNDAAVRVRNARAAARAAGEARNQAVAALSLASASYEVAQGRLATLKGQLDAAYAAVTSAQLLLNALPVPETESAALKVNATRAQAKQAAADLVTAREALRGAEAARQRAIDDYERALSTVERIEQDLTARRAELTELTFNNALVKRIKQVRPLIADKLWNLVLAAVSLYFSEMRGVPSKVTKDGDGFKVDGRDISTLSGSTLDILGLAIRIALVRTFLPTAPFLVLDEPAAAMDDQRTGNMLGFLQGCGFNQIIAATHEDVSESVADSVVELAS